MTKTQQRQMLKGECFNRLMKLFHPLANWKGDSSDRESSYREQRDNQAQYIVEQYLEKLEKVNSLNQKSLKKKQDYEKVKTIYNRRIDRIVTVVDYMVKYPSNYLNNKIMKVGIRFYDNDFYNSITMFIDLFIEPTFIDRGDGHMITHLTSSQIVELFNTHCVYCYKYQRDNDKRHWQNNSPFDINWYKEYLKITEANIFWDGELEKALIEWDGDMYIANGKID